MGNLSKSVICPLMLAAIALTGCSTGFLKPTKESVSKNDSYSQYATEKLRRGQSLGHYQAQTPIKHVDNAWLPVTKIARTDPAADFSLNRSVIVNRQFSSLEDVTYYITQLAGLRAVVNASAVNSGVSGAGSDVSGAQTGSSSDRSDSIQISYNGSLSGFLNLVAARYGVFWEWQNDSVVFFKTKTKTFRITALPGDTSLTSTVSSSTGGSETGSSGSSDSGSGNSTQTSSEMSASVQFSGMSIWTSIENSIKTMLSSSGALSVTPATGTITVSDTPVVLEKVERFINDQNASLSKQVVINVRVLSVEMNHTDGYGINWDVVYENLTKKIGIDLSNQFAVTAGTANNLSFRVLSGSSWQGTSAMVDALSTQGNVSQVTSASIVTINNQPAPILVGRQKSYLASSTTTLDDTGGASSISLTPGTVTSGLSMSVLPHILDDKKLMLQYSGDLSSLTDLDTVTSGDSVIQTPEVDVRNFMQRVILNSGEILVVAGFEQFDLNGQSSGVGHPENMLLGGGLNSSNNKNVIVVLIQPILMNEKR